MESSDREVLSAREQKISRDKLAKFKGAARVHITHLDFPHPSRKIDRRVIEQLKRDFDGEGCLRKEPINRIPAMIDSSILQAALEKLSMSAEAFETRSGNPPGLHLESEVKLECLHGQHRILAAKEYLYPSQRWWIVDLYGTDLDNDTKQAFREGYSYSAKYRSGEIFRYIRLCHFDNDEIGVERWRSRLSKHQDKFLKLLLKRGILIKALDSVLHIQGLWRTFYVGSLDIFFTLRCDEEIARCVRFIKHFWTRVLEDDMPTLMNTDPFTIESLQSRAPALCKSDFDFIQERMGSFFPEVTDPVRRSNITQHLLATEELIPTLYTLTKDIRYLKQPAAILSTLLPKASKKTLRQRFSFHFTGMEMTEDTIEVQQSASSYTTIPRNRLDSFDVAYQQLWLCSYRVWKHPNAYGLDQLATLAHRLGFSTTEIECEVGKDPGQALIEKAVREVLYILRPNEKFSFDANQARPLITSFNDYLDGMLGTPPTMASPYITVAGSGEPLSRRCGHGCMDSEDLNHLFLEKIHAPLQEYQRGGDEISSFYVKRSRHISFFGALNFTEAQQDRSTHLPSADPSREQRTTRPVLAGARPAASDSARRERAPNLDQGSLNQVQNQAVSFSGPAVTFMENGIAIRQVPYEKQQVNNQAREYANQGKKLHVPQGPHFIWQECFDILERTRNSTVLVSNVLEPINGKRRQGQDLPDRFQLVGSFISEEES